MLESPLPRLTSTLSTRGSVYDSGSNETVAVERQYFVIELPRRKQYAFLNVEYRRSFLDRVEQTASLHVIALQRCFLSRYQRPPILRAAMMYFLHLASPRRRCWSGRANSIFDCTSSCLNTSLVCPPISRSLNRCSSIERVSCASGSI